MGEVYLAEDLKLERKVAIKFLPQSLTHDKENVERFQREAETLAKLKHPNIAAIYGLEEANGTPFLALELVEGEDLGERLVAVVGATHSPDLAVVQQGDLEVERLLPNPRLRHGLLQVTSQVASALAGRFAAGAALEDPASLDTETLVALAATLMATGTRNLNAALKERNIFCTLSSIE